VKKLALISSTKKHKPPSEYLHFAYCPTTEVFEFCETEKEALDIAFQQIWDKCNGNGKPWDKGADQIVVGKITHKAAEVLIKRPEKLGTIPIPLNATFVDSETDLTWERGIASQAEFEMKII
jgi:hypothetical protein